MLNYFCIILFYFYLCFTPIDVILNFKLSTLNIQFDYFPFFLQFNQHELTTVTCAF
jgi:hypothetical protein